MLRALAINGSLAVATLGTLALTLTVTLDPAWGVAPALYGLAATLVGSLSFGLAAGPEQAPDPEPIRVNPFGWDRID